MYARIHEAASLVAKTRPTDIYEYMHAAHVDFEDQNSEFDFVHIRDEDELTPLDSFAAEPDASSDDWGYYIRIPI